MPSLAISPGDLALLQQIPQQIASVANTVTSTIGAIQNGEDTGNPLGALFGGLSSLSEQAGSLPSISALVAPLQELAAELPGGTIGDLTAIGAEIEELLGLFGPLKDKLLSGEVDASLSQAATQAIDQLRALVTPSDEVTRAFAEAQDAIGLLRTALEWQHRAPRVEELVDLLGRGIAGVGPDLLKEPAAALERVLGPLEAILPVGAELEAWRTAPQRIAAFWTGIRARFDAPAALDWSALEADLLAESGRLIELGAARDRVIADSLANLGRVDLSGLSGVAQALSSLPPLRDLRVEPILTGLEQFLESMVANLEAWAPTEEQARATVRELADELLAYVEHSPLGQFRALLVDFQQRILSAIESLPFRALTAQVEALLRRVAGAIDVVDPDIVRQPVHDFFQGIEAELDELAGASVPEALNDLWSQVDGAIQQIGAGVEQLKATLQSLVGQVTGFIDSIKPAMDAISEGVASIQALLDGFDLAEPAAAIIDELGRLRDKVAALDLSALPDAAISALNAGADLLRGLDLAAEINPALNDALAIADPTPLLDEALKSISIVTDQLALLDPKTLARELDKPVDALLAAFSQLGPQQLRALLQEALRPLEDAIRGLDMSQLFAPITRLFAELQAKIDAVLDPDLIFAPLEALFQPVVDLIDGAKPSRFIALLSPHGGGFAESLGSAAGPPGVLKGANLKGMIPAAPEADDDLFGFRIGDLLIPLIDVHRVIMGAIDGVDDATLSSAGQSLAASFGLRLRALAPSGVSLRAGAALGGVRAELGPADVSQRLGAAFDAYYEAASALAAAPREGLSAEQAAAADRAQALLEQVNPLRLVPESVQFEGIGDISATLQSSADRAGAGFGLAGLARAEELIPDFLKADIVDASAIRAVLQAFDPAPLRLRLNSLFDRIGRRVVALQAVFFAAVEELGRVAEEFLLPLSPGNLVSLADRLHAALAEQVLFFHPRQLKDEVQLIFDAVKRQLGAFDPSFVVEELEALRDHLIERLRELLAQLIPDSVAFDELKVKLAGLKPSALLAPLEASLEPVSKAVASLDPKLLFEPLIGAIARVRADVPEVVSSIEAALDEVLAAFPDGGSSGGSAGAQVG